MGEWILDNLTRHPLKGDPYGPIGGQMKKWLGHAVIAMPFEGHVALNYTGPIGSVMGIYYGLVFQLGKWEYNRFKADEWVEVSPVHAQYYQLTHKQKEDLEGKIKQGLVSVSQTVADMELLMHDKRRYLEYLHYMGYRTKRETGKKNGANDDLDELDLDDEKDLKKHADNHSLKAVFIDQVDMHTGEGISMRSIVARWPTLITDFMNMADDDLDIDKVSKKLDISRAEAVVLITKNKLYQEWKRIFGPEIKGRYRRIQDLLNMREESLKQYKEWLKPFIARHRMIKEGLSTPARGFKTITPFESGGVATSTSEIVLYAWKDFLVPEIFKGGSEETGKLLMQTGKTKFDNRIPVDDAWTKRNLIFGDKFGLINKYDWITEEWVHDQKEWMFQNRWLTPHKPYYSFFVITTTRATTRMPTGEELDDGIFDINMIMMSQNACFVKLLELKAKQQEMEDYINKMLGLHKAMSGKRPGDEKSRKNQAANFLKYFNMGMMFSKGGPYERDFEDRITKIYLARCAQERYAPIVNFIKKKMGMSGK